MVSDERDRWYEAAAIELARQVGDRYSISSWRDDVWERVIAARCSPSEAVEMLLRHRPTEAQQASQSGQMSTPVS